MRKIGLIGGMSWIATRAYYERVNRRVQQLGQASASAPMLIESLDNAPISLARQNDDWETIAAVLTESATRLEKAGAEGLVIASNAMHRAYDDIAAAVTIPVLHVADAVGERLQNARVTSAALLGTRAVMTESFYRQRLVSYGVNLLPPEMNDVELVDGIIYKELMLGRVTRAAERALKTVITTREKRGARAIVLASSELGLVVDTRANVLPVFDATEIHCDAIANWSLERTEP